MSRVAPRVIIKGLIATAAGWTVEALLVSHYGLKHGFVVGVIGVMTGFLVMLGLLELIP